MSENDVEKILFNIKVNKRTGAQRTQKKVRTLSDTEKFN